MSLLTRVFQKAFGSTAAANRIGQFGSLSNGSPTAYSGATATGSNVQALSNFLEGLDGSLVGSGSTPIQDANALFYLAFYQLQYILQQGIPEYDSSTVYNSNSLVLYQNILYQSLTASQSGNLPSSGSPWAVFGTRTKPTVQTFTSTGTYTPSAGVTWFKVTLVGGGGGGAGGGATSNPGGNGSATIFNGILTAGGGQAANFAGGGGGSNSNSGSNYTLLASIEGGAGGGGFLNAGAAVNFTGGIGGSSYFGGAGIGGYGTVGGFATPNSGSGGGGGGEDNFTTSLTTGGGGGAGGLIIALFNTVIASSYSVIVGAGGTGGTASGGNGYAGGNGAIGIVIIEEHYNY